MGSFSFTCGISGLPIEAGDPVRYFLLAESPYKSDNIKCDLHSYWWVRTLPIKAEYNDYGSIENWKHPQIIQLWQDSLDLDLIEKGRGDNSCHDVAVRKGMSFEALLEAVWKGRLEIKSKVGLYPESPDTILSSKKSEFSGAALEGVPTFQNLTDELGSDFLVDEEYYGSVRVRFNSLEVSRERYGDDLKELTIIMDKLSDRYSCMVAAGTGSYAHRAELIIRPLPGTKHYHYRKGSTPAALKVAQVMIREDVWQACLNTPYEGYDRKTYETIDVHYEPSCDMSILQPTEITPFVEERIRDEIPFTVGRSSLIRQAAGRDWDEETSIAFVQSYEELKHIESVLRYVRHQWQPSNGNGPQFGEWTMHEKFHDKIGEIVRFKAEEQRKWREEDGE